MSIYKGNRKEHDLLQMFQSVTKNTSHTMPDQLELIMKLFEAPCDFYDNKPYCVRINVNIYMLFFKAGAVSYVGGLQPQSPATHHPQTAV
jgi:hypothetical protein